MVVRSLLFGRSAPANPSRQRRLEAQQPLIQSQLTAVVHLLVDAVVQHRDLIVAGDGGLHFITHLPGSALSGGAPSGSTAAAPPPAPLPEPEPEPEPAVPTRCHITIDGEQVVLLHQSGPPPLLDGVAVAESAALGSDTTITLADGRRWRLVAIDGDHGSQT